MGVTVRRNFAPLTEAVRWTQEDWAAVGRLARERILARTLQGRDVDGQPFAPYSPGYLLQKDRATGGGFDVGGSARVNLTLSGEMLRGIQIVAHADRVELTF